MDSDAMKNAQCQYEQKTTFRDKFKVVWDNLAQYNDMNTGNTKKTVGHSILWKKVGNKEFTAAKNEHYLRKSIEAYTKSIAFAPVGSKELSLAYANRSAVLSKARLYEDCLLDIERSLKAGYPDKLKTKLFLRQSLCFKALKPSSHIESGISMLKKTKKNNQHVVATRDIKSGEFIYISEPLAATPGRELRFTNCWHCCRSTWAGVPCDNCPNVIYCSVICKKKAWDSYHNIECLVLGELFQHANIPTGFILPVKLFLKTLNLAGGLLELKKKVDDIDSMKNQGSILTNGILDVNTVSNVHLLEYFKPTSNICSFEIALLVVTIVSTLCQKTDILGKKMTAKYLVENKNEKILILGELILRYMMIVYRSGEVMSKKKSGSNVVLSNTMLSFSTIIKPSCDPNVNWTHVGSNVGYYACKPIKQGEPLLLSTTDSYHKSPKIERCARLGPCKCKACVENWPTVEHLPSYQSLAIILPTTINRELNCLNVKFKEWQKLIQQGDTKKLSTIKDELNSMNDMIHQYITVPCREISILHSLLKSLYRQLHCVHDIYD
ncbi:SET and MYND domain-containing protein 4-like [Aphidius gifuensis]|uniref:SET and MYND domain-containing protein 4-like n=1 Tax=Aphidius gifuensis TaxID=684658 RepID=UPI001CDC4519|nr:SET and MYND domain-containing protein 4-like [Aphidius gifuensis]